MSIRHSLPSAPLNQITVPREWENPSSVTHSLPPQTSAHRDFVPTPAVRPSTAGCPQTSSDTAACRRWLLSDTRLTPTHGASGAGRTGAPSVTNSRPPQTSALRDSLPTAAARPSTAGCSQTSSDTAARCLGSWEDGCSTGPQTTVPPSRVAPRLPPTPACCSLQPPTLLSFRTSSPYNRQWQARYT